MGLLFTTEDMKKIKYNILDTSKKFLTHLCILKLFNEAFFCFPVTGNNLTTLIFLFNCIYMILNIPTCF